ncbi:hypothetical protein [Cereibacter sphaeroides]|uniref:hypothetical protein n=1 Tax=Cereibacter sphaeroides TaxID=1063 RepID=UPI0011C3E0E1|nr:hypothetical protein [Cereibacter sphaeroides]
MSDGGDNLRLALHAGGSISLACLLKLIERAATAPRRRVAGIRPGRLVSGEITLAKVEAREC